MFRHVSEHILYSSIFFPWGFSKAFFSDPNAAISAITTAATLPPVIDLIGYKAQFAALITHDTRELLSTITAETLVLAGADDILTPPTDGQYLATNIPNAKYYEFTGQAQTVHIEAPLEFAQVVQDFLR